MTYVIDSINPRAGLRGYSGTSGLGDTAKMDLLKIQKAIASGAITVAQAEQLKAAQRAWDSKANMLRQALRIAMTSAQAEAEVRRRLGPRPSLATIRVSTSSTKIGPAPTSPALRPGLRLPSPTFRLRAPGAGVQSGADAPEGPPPSADGGEIVGPPPSDGGAGGGPSMGLVAAGAVVLGALVLFARR